jgi:spore coat polysaccharide biosynthesis protein SpsF
MGSTRLPGKVLRDIAGEPMLWRVVERTRRATAVYGVIVATTTEPADDVLAEFCRERQIPCFRGDENNVLDRYYRAALQAHADAVVRITSDCPLIDPEVVDRVVHAFLAGDYDYASNCLRRTYPRGLDTEIMTFRALDRAWREATLPYERAHVTPYLYETPGRFKLLSVTAAAGEMRDGEVGDQENYGDGRWTVDTPEDLEFVRAVYSRMEDDSFSWRDVLQLLEREPELAAINRSIAQKALHEG